MARKKQRRIERAIAEGREPGKVGGQRRLTDAERKAHRAISTKRYIQKHPDTYRATQVAASKKTRDRLKVQNPEAYKMQMLANGAHMRAKRYGMERDAGVSLTAVVTRVWKAAGGVCAACQSTEKLELDHILALANGGTNAETNLQFLCEPCNRSKGDRDWTYWLAHRVQPMEIAA